MQLVEFTHEHYNEYQSWFQDDLMQKYLGSIDSEWLDYILNDDTGEELVAELNGKMVGVVGVTFPVMDNSFYVITNLAVHPELKRKRIGTQIIKLLKDYYKLKKSEYWVTYVHINNRIAQNFISKVGWVRRNVDDEMITYTDS